MSLAHLVTVVSLFAGQPCAGLDNTTNQYAFRIPGRTISGTYREYDRLVYRPAPKAHQRAQWRSLHAAEVTLNYTSAGPKVAIACS